VSTDLEGFRAHLEALHALNKDVIEGRYRPPDEWL
jgi:hypothetical protein